MGEEKTCFVIGPIGPPDSEQRAWADEIFEYLLRPVVEEYGYEIARADRIDEPGVIPHHISEHLLEDDLVVADLTNKNPNVFYELGVRHLLQDRPTIHVCREGTELPFDVEQIRTIFIDKGRLESVENAKQRLANQIEEIEAGKTDLANPISVGLTVSELRRTGERSDQAIGDTLDAAMEILSRIEGIQRKVDSLDRRVNPIDDASGGGPTGPRPSSHEIAGDGDRDGERILQLECKGCGETFSTGISVGFAGRPALGSHTFACPHCGSQASYKGEDFH